jgi:hypothetical protein
MSSAVIGRDPLNDGEDPGLDRRGPLELDEPSGGDPEDVLRRILQAIWRDPEQAQRPADEIEVLSIDHLEIESGA